MTIGWRQTGVVNDVAPARGLDGEALWRAYSTELVRYATLLVGPSDSADVVATAFVSVTLSAAAPANPRAYLYRAVTNCAVDQHRSRRRRQARDLHAVLPSLGGQPDADLDVRRAVATLSVRQHAVVYFTYWQDLDEQHIADVLGISSGSVRRHLARARAHLRKALS